MTDRTAPHIQQITYYDRVYHVDIYGYLVDPQEWTERFANRKATEMGLGRFESNHWTFIRFLREQYLKTGSIPTVGEACQGTGINREEFEELFPLGYLRCAVKLAGLNPVKRTAQI